MRGVRESRTGLGSAKRTPNAAITLVDLPPARILPLQSSSQTTPFGSSSFFPSQCKGVTKASPIYSKWRNCEIKLQPRKRIEREIAARTIKIVCNCRWYRGGMSSPSLSLPNQRRRRRKLGRPPRPSTPRSTGEERSFARRESERAPFIESRADGGGKSESGKRRVRRSQ